MLSYRLHPRVLTQSYTRLLLLLACVECVFDAIYHKPRTAVGAAKVFPRIDAIYVKLCIKPMPLGCTISNPVLGDWSLQGYI